MVESVLHRGVDFDWRNSPLFRFFEESDWELFLRATEFCKKPAGCELWVEGCRDALLICILSGSLESIKKTPGWGKPIIMAEFLSGATVGEPVFDEPGVHSTSLRVIDESQLLICRPEGAARLFKDYPATASKLWHGSASLQQLRLRQANARLATLF